MIVTGVIAVGALLTPELGKREIFGTAIDLAQGLEVLRIGDDNEAIALDLARGTTQTIQTLFPCVLEITRIHILAMKML